MSQATFLPLLSPTEIIERGAFGGTYFGLTAVEPADFNYNKLFEVCFTEIDKSLYLGEKYDRKLNCFKVKSGMPYEYWRDMDWMHADDPYGWFEWYCKFYLGRRHDDDHRQIMRWHNFCGNRGRWRKAIYKRIHETKDWNISPIIQQSLMHWGYEVNEDDYSLWQDNHLR